MPLNEDVIFIILKFCFQETLRNLCLVSRTLHRLAARQLYRSARISRHATLTPFMDAVERDPNIASAVMSFTEAVGRDTIPGAHADFLDIVARVIAALPNVETIWLACFELQHDNIPHALNIYTAIAQRPRLRNLRLRGVTTNALLQLGEMGNIAHLDISFHSNVPRFVSLAWLFNIAQQARVLAIDGMLLQYGLRNVNKDQTFPDVYGLSAHSESVLGLSPTLRLIHAFPSLRALSLGFNITSHIRQLSDYLDVHLPFLRHLELQEWDSGLLSPNHSVSSLRLHVGISDLILNPGQYMGLVASANVRALSLEWGSAGSFPIAEAAMAVFRGLNSLRVRVRADDTATIRTWLRDRVSEIVPVNLAALTITWTSATSVVQPVSHDDVAALGSGAPSLKLLRIAKRTDRGFSACCAWRIGAPETPRALDWDDACSLANEYLHAAGAPSSPWDDIAAF